MTTPTASAATPSRRSFRTYLWGGLAVVILLFVAYTWLMLSWSYSDGERAGVLQKFSKRGWLCKTYEGELAMYVVGGIAPQIWLFSVRDPQVVEQLHGAVGQQVRLGYAEHRGLPTNCFGETDYFITRVEVVGPPPFMQGAPAQAAPAAAAPAAAAPPATP